MASLFEPCCEKNLSSVCNKAIVKESTKLQTLENSGGTNRCRPGAG